MKRIVSSGRATRLATGTGWKPVECVQTCLAGSTPAPSAVAGSGAGFRRQTVNLFDGGSIPLGHPRFLRTFPMRQGSVREMSNDAPVQIEKGQMTNE